MNTNKVANNKTPTKAETPKYNPNNYKSFTDFEEVIKNSNGKDECQKVYYLIIANSLLI